MIAVLLVDNDRFALEGMHTWLAPEPDLHILGLALHGDLALLAVAEHQPQVVVLDLHLAGRGSLGVLDELTARWPQIGCVVLSSDPTPPSLFAAVQHGARGYLLKTAPPQELVTAIRLVAAGHAFIPPPLLALLLPAFQAPPGPVVAPLTAAPLLTPREAAVLQALVAGATNQEIAQRLGLGERTIKRVLTTLFQKLGVPDRTQAVRYACQHAWVQEPGTAPPLAVAGTLPSAPRYSRVR